MANEGRELSFRIEPTAADRLIKAGVRVMSTEREAVRQKLLQSRRLLDQSTDPATIERLRPISNSRAAGAEPDVARSRLMLLAA
jgi:hypothetical protein